MAFELDPALETIHQPVRLKLMALLFQHRDVSFAEARDALGVSDGNLGSHAKVLEEKGLLESRKALARTGFQVRFQITEAGSKSFESYTQALRLFLANLDRLAPR